MFSHDHVCVSAGNRAFGDDGLTAVAEGLQSNSNLTHVDLRCTSKLLAVITDCADSCLTCVLFGIRVRHEHEERCSMGGRAAVGLSTAKSVVHKCGGGGGGVCFEAA